MVWIIKHPFVSLVIAVLLFGAYGGWILAHRTDVSPLISSVGVWRDPYHTDAPPQYGSSATSSDTTVLKEGHYNPTDVPIPTISAAQPAPNIAVEDMSNSSADAYMQFVSQMLTQEKKNAKKATTTPILPNLSFEPIPRTLISTVDKEPKYTSAQQDLYDYGNAVGTILQGYENAHSDQSAVVQDHIQDRSNPLKKASLAALAKDISSVGTQLSQLADVPLSVETTHNNLAQSYTDMGTKLTAVAKSERDQDFVDAVLSYDKSVDGYIKHYVALADVFKLAGITFNKDDPGSVFTFTQ